MNEADWTRLIDQLQDGKCTPFLGAGACVGVLPTAAQLSTEWATRHKYPFAQNEDLARVMQYAAYSMGDTVYVKERVCNDLRATHPPDYADPLEPHALLAGFPVPVFITTNYDDFLVRALRRAGKEPHSAICSWSNGVDYDHEYFDHSAGLSPSASHPVVYHLHGSMHEPRSLVLTENDYLEFLVKIASSQDSEKLQLIPGAVMSALTDNPLLFIGYSFQDWTFRVIFHGLLSAIPSVHRRRSVSVQLPPPLHSSVADAETLARQYLNQYLEAWSISIYWGTAADFCRELRSRSGRG
jgi:SIR2-like protein